MNKLTTKSELMNVIKTDQDILRIRSMGDAKRFELSFLERTHSKLFLIRLVERLKRRRLMLKMIGIVSKIIALSSMENMRQDALDNDANNLIHAPRVLLKNHMPASSFSHLKLPLDNINAPSTQNRIAIVFHGYYLDEVARTLPFFKNIPSPFKLFISTNTDEKKDLIAEKLRSFNMGDAEIRVTPNKGRDIAPFLISFTDVLGDYDYVLHMHTKKSPHDINYAYWGRYFIQNLIGTPEIIASTLKIFEKNPHIGMIAPEHYHRLAGGIVWGPNYPLCKKLLSAMGVAINEYSAIDFPSGSMFWARVDALKPLLDLNLSYDDFPEEAGQKDGTLAHAIERLFFYSCELQNYSWIRTLTPTYQEIGSKELSEDDLRKAKKILLG